MPTSGGCLCGRVRYEFDGVPAAALNCHCSLCRKAHGAAAIAFAVVRAKNFRWLSGVEDLASYNATSGFTRQFCRHCGSQLVVLEDWNPRGVTLAMGSLDGEAGITIEGHMFVGSKAPWHEISDNLPQHRAWPAGLGPPSAACSEEQD